MNKHVLILGSNSFTGAHLINYLLDQTECHVVGISRSPEYDPVFLPHLYRKPRSSRYTFHQIDLNTEMEKVSSVCQAFQPSVVVNFAAQGEVRHSWRWPEQWYRTNCLSVIRLSEFLRNQSCLKKYIAVSTPEVYGTTGDKMKENHRYQPSTPYAISKLAGDLHLLSLFKRYGFPVVLTRAVNLYGIHQQLYRIIPRTIIYLKMGKPIELHGRGQAMRAFIHARDVADLTVRAIQHGRCGEVYHVASDDGLRRIADVVRLICRLTNHAFEPSVKFVDENYGQDFQFSLDASKAKQELGWRPTIDFEQGVRETIDWIEGNWDVIRKQPFEYIHKE